MTLAADRSEMHNLAMEHPEKVREMEQRWTVEMEAMQRLAK